MKNEGLGRIRLESDMSLIRVDALPAHEWMPGATARWEEENPIMVTTTFQKHGWIEPGETITDQVLLPLPSENPAAVACSHAGQRPVLLAKRRPTSRCSSIDGCRCAEQQQRERRDRQRERRGVEHRFYDGPRGLR
jgi:hypothetical protein